MKRINYLRSIKQARAENSPNVYIDESYILSSHVTEKGWGDASLQGFKKKISKDNRAIILHAGGEMGFIPGACLIWKAGTSKGDYHDQINYANLMTWTRTQLIPNLPVNSNNY
ncbi:hypothetical protein J6590_108370 [Homalodisca vitripennis]|nr:hypothetical protein J6590_108370 [Homalodisca vitripennis]